MVHRYGVWLSLVAALAGTVEGTSFGFRPNSRASPDDLITADVFQQDDASHATRNEPRIRSVDQGLEPVVLAAYSPKTFSENITDPLGGFTLRKEHTVRWGGRGSLAELHAYAEEHERILDTEFFDDLIETIKCPGELDQSGTIDIHFEDEGYFAATQGWEWVNSPEHEIILTVGPGICGWNEHRLLYLVSSVSIFDDEKRVILQARATTWRDAIRNFHLKIGKDTKTLGARWAKDFTFDFDDDLSDKGFQWDHGRTTILGMCIQCRLQGNMGVEFEYKTGIPLISDAELSARVHTDGIKIDAAIQFQFKGRMFKVWSPPPITFFETGVPGLSIPGVYNVGPIVKVEIKTTLKFRAGFTLNWASVVMIPPSSLQLDLFQSALEPLEMKGWNIISSSPEWNVEGQVEMEVDISLMPHIGFEFSVMSVGGNLLLNSEAPALWNIARLLGSDKCVICDEYNAGIKFMSMVAYSTSVGLELLGGPLGDRDLGTFSLFEAPAETFHVECIGLGDKCSAGGDDNDASGGIGGSIGPGTEDEDTSGGVGGPIGPGTNDGDADDEDEEDISGGIGGPLGPGDGEPDDTDEVDEDDTSGGVGGPIGPGTGDEDEDESDEDDTDEDGTSGSVGGPIGPGTGDEDEEEPDEIEPDEDEPDEDEPDEDEPDEDEPDEDEPDEDDTDEDEPDEDDTDEDGTSGGVGGPIGPGTGDEDEDEPDDEGTAGGVGGSLGPAGGGDDEVYV